MFTLEQLRMRRSNAVRPTNCTCSPGLCGYHSTGLGRPNEHCTLTIVAEALIPVTSEEL